MNVFLIMQNDKNVGVVVDAEGGLPEAKKRAKRLSLKDGTVRVLENGLGGPCRMTRWARRSARAAHVALTPEQRELLDEAADVAAQEAADADAFVEDFWQKRGRTEEARRMARIMARKED